MINFYTEFQLTSLATETYCFDSRTFSDSRFLNCFDNSIVIKEYISFTILEIVWGFICYYS